MAESATASSTQLSGFWRRIAALVIDLIILGAPLFVAGIVFFDWAVRVGLWGRAIGFVVGLTYFAMMNSEPAGGQSLGMRLLRIKVVGRDGLPVSVARAAARYCVISVPYLLNGVWFSGGVRVSAIDLYVLGPLLGLVVFGGLGSVAYLYVFNRGTRQSLHDLATDCFVVRRTATGGVPLHVSRLHLAVIGIWSLVTLVPLPAFVHLAAFEAVSPLFPLQNGIAARPDVRSVQVAAGTSYFSSTSSGSASQSVLSVSVQLRRRPDDIKAAALSIARAVLASAPDLLGRQVLAVNVAYGFDFGIAAWSVGYNDSGRAEDWARKSP